jgi:hypothetical protein
MPGELDRLPAEFPETSKVSDLAHLMVQVDTRWDNLKRIRAAGWKTPPDEADLDPAHEALQLFEQYREAGRLKKGSEEMRQWLAAAEGEVDQLLQALRKKDATAAEKAFRSAGATCGRCHAKYRDISQP